LRFIPEQSLGVALQSPGMMLELAPVARELESGLQGLESVRHEL